MQSVFAKGYSTPYLSTPGADGNRISTDGFGDLVADELAQWLVSDRGQSVINGYRLLGKQLFYPDAIK